MSGIAMQFCPGKTHQIVKTFLDVKGPSGSEKIFLTLLKIGLKNNSSHLVVWEDLRLFPRRNRALSLNIEEKTAGIQLDS